MFRKEDSFMWLFVESLLVAVFVAFATATLVHLLEGGHFVDTVKVKSKRKARKRLGALEEIRAGYWVKPVVIGLMVGVAMFVTPKLEGIPLAAAIPYVAMMALMCYLVYWWHEEGSNWKEFLIFDLILGIACNVGKEASEILIIFYQEAHPNLAKATTIIPDVLDVFGTGFFIIDGLVHYVRERDDDEEDDDDYDDYEY